MNALHHRAALALAAVAASWALAAPARAQVRDDSRIGRVSLGVATASAPRGTFLYDGGVIVGFAGPRFDLGLGFGGASAPLASGERAMFQVAPEAGYHVGWRSRDRKAIVHLYGAARMPFQTRSGAGLPSETGLALSGEVGVRLWGCSIDDPHLEGMCFGFGIGARYQRHLTEYQMGPAVLPAQSSVLSFPVTLDFGFNADIL